MQVRSLGQKDPLEDMATHSSGVTLAWLQGLLRKTECLYKHHPHLLGMNWNPILGLFYVVKLLCFNELSPNGIIFWLIYSKKYYLRISMRFTKISFLVIGWLRTTPVFLPGESPWTEEPGRLQFHGVVKRWTWLKWLSMHPCSLGLRQCISQMTTIYSFLKYNNEDNSKRF